MLAKQCATLTRGLSITTLTRHRVADKDKTEQQPVTGITHDPQNGLDCCINVTGRLMLSTCAPGAPHGMNTASTYSTCNCMDKHAQSAGLLVCITTHQALKESLLMALRPTNLQHKQDPSSNRPGHESDVPNSQHMPAACYPPGHSSETTSQQPHLIVGRQVIRHIRQGARQSARQGLSVVIPR